MHSKLSLGGSLLALILLVTTAEADVRRVDANLFTGSNNGSSWSDAFFGPNGLQSALAVSSSGDQIWCAEGTYVPTSGTSRAVSIVLKNGVEIYGGFDGTESALDQRPAHGVAPSVLSGDLAGNDGGGSMNENSYHVLKGTGTNASAVLDGFFIRGGNANSSGNNNKGGGILCISSSSPTIRNCTFEGNRCTFGGGAGYISGSAPSFTDCVFDSNTGGSYGGAFDIAGAGAIVFDRCEFMGNTAARAGALEIYSTNGVKVTNCVFHGNTATGGGGGGALWMGSGGNTQLRNCTIVANFSTTSSAAGLRVSGGSPSIANCIFWDNTGPGGAQGTSNQVLGTTAVSYSIVEGGLSGTGNLSTPPLFSDAGSSDYSLLEASAGVDAGSNSMVPAGIVLDFARGARFADAAVADTGAGAAPIVDMGAHEVRPVAILAYCFGDGSGTTCPCGNTGAVGSGCANSVHPEGCELSASGTPSVSSDTLVLSATKSMPSQPGIFFLANNAVNSGMGNSFGDGLRCAGGGVKRLQVRFAGGAGNASSSVNISQAAGLVAGDLRRLQWWYRNPVGSPCGFGFNLSNGLEVTWTL
jgi:hypothetical protein